MLRQVLISLVALVTLFALVGYAQVTCVTGCNSFYTGYSWVQGEIGIDPYQCKEGNDKWADVDEGGPCEALLPNDPVTTATFWGGCLCDAVCWGPCPQGDNCLLSCNCGVQGSYYLSSQDRLECHGIHL